MRNSKQSSTGPFIVLGMHKSGTTLISEVLHASGVSMVAGSTEGNYDSGNTMEHEEFKSVNFELLECTDKACVETVEELDVSGVTDDQWSKGKKLIQKYKDENMAWGFKDPRTLLTLDYWQHLIPNRRLIGVYRDPAEVFHHYSTKKRPSKFRNDKQYPVMALYAWSVYNNHLLDIVRHERDMVLLNYKNVMQDENGLAPLSEFVGCQIKDCRKKSLQRSASTRTFSYLFARLQVIFRFGMDPNRIYRSLVRMT